jgi:hypothetical protein
MFKSNLQAKKKEEKIKVINMPPILDTKLNQLFYKSKSINLNSK